MLDLNPNKNLFFSLNIDRATGQVLQVNAANRLVSRLKKTSECSSYCGLMMPQSTLICLIKVPSVRAENTYHKNDSVRQSKSTTPL